MNSGAKYFIFVCALAMPALSTNLSAKEQVYGWELMTEQERAEHRTKMQSFNTTEERERYRLEHHKKMQKRAEKQGLTLPAKPQSHGQGMGKGAAGGGGGR